MREKNRKKGNMYTVYKGVNHENKVGSIRERCELPE